MPDRTVFGSDRPKAAVRAISELSAARAAVAAAGWAADESVLRRLADARAERERYSEYGETFRGH